jgi:hypothetical protein
MVYALLSKPAFMGAGTNPKPCVSYVFAPYIRAHTFLPCFSIRHFTFCNLRGKLSNLLDVIGQILHMDVVAIMIAVIPDQGFI